MKRYITFILFVFITVGTWASGASEQNTPKSYRFYTEKLVFNDDVIDLTDGVQVQPSDTVIGVIDDYIYDVYDDDNDDYDDYKDIRLPRNDYIFSDISQWLQVGTDYSTVSKFFSLYVDDVLAANTDDILYDINEELVSVLKEKNVDKTFMILGDTKVICVKDFNI